MNRIFKPYVLKLTGCQCQVSIPNLVTPYYYLMKEEN